MYLYDHEDNELIMDVLLELARAENKSLQRIKRLLFVKENRAISRKFWELLNIRLPEYADCKLYYCPDCKAVMVAEEIYA